MAAQIPIPKKRLLELKKFREAKVSGLDLRHFLCVWLRAEQGLNALEIARAVGCHEVTVRIVQRDFITRGTEAFGGDKRGGRRRCLMTLEEEKDFLDGFVEAASEASLLVVNEIKLALEEKLGRKVHKTTVYRMMKRHKWRKIKPRPSHPKQDKEAATAFKKRATQKQ
jgi:transposase